MLRLFSGFLVLWLASAGFYASNSGVKELNADDFDDFVGKEGETCIVEFYAPWCGHCKQLKPEYEKLSKMLKGQIGVYAVDASEDQNRPIAQRFGIQGFPTIKVWKGKKVMDYQGARTADGMAEFARKHVVVNIKQVTTKNFEKFLKKEKVQVLIFSKKGSVEPAYGAVSNRFKKFASFGQVRKDKKLAKKFKVDFDDEPILVFPKDETEPETYMYKGAGPLKARSFRKYLKKFVPDAPDDPDDFLPEITDNSCFKERCKKKGLCVLVISSHDENDSERIHDAVLEVKENHHSASLFAFAKIDGVKHRSWVEEVFGKGLNLDLPQIIVLSAVKKRYASYMGSGSVNSVSSFVGGILSGKTRTTPCEFKDDEFPPIGSTETTDCKAKKKPKKQKPQQQPGGGGGSGEEFNKESSEFITPLTSDNFAEEIIDSTQPSLVTFYAPWCGHCKRLAPEYAKAADKLKGMMKMGAVDCTAHQDLCEEYQVQGFPTMKFFPAESDEPEDYQGQRTARGITSLAGRLIEMGASVKRIKSKDQLLEGEGTRVFLLTTKKKIPRILNALSCKYSNYAVLIGDETNEDVLEHLGVKEADLPVIGMMTPESDKHFRYKGETSFSAIDAWVEDVSTGGGSEADSQGGHDEL